MSISEYRIAIPIPYMNFTQFAADYKIAAGPRPHLIEIRFDYSEELKTRLSKLATLPELTNLFQNQGSNLSSKSTSSKSSTSKSTSSESKVSLDPAIKSKILSVLELELIFPRKIMMLGTKGPMAVEEHLIPFIFTLRASSQGGQQPIPEPIRILIMEYLLSFEPAFVDLEVDIEPRIITSLTEMAKKSGTQIILSQHDFEATPSYKKIAATIDDLIVRFPHILPPLGIVRFPHILPPQPSFILKLVYTARNIGDNEVVLKICRDYTQKGIKLVCFCMGIEGISSRIGSLLCGAYFSFASFGKNTAPGQIPIADFRELLRDAVTKGVESTQKD